MQAIEKVLGIILVIIGMGWYLALKFRIVGPDSSPPECSDIVTLLREPPVTELDKQAELQTLFTEHE